VLQASACNTDTTPTQPHRISNTHRTKNNTTNVVIQQNRRKLLIMDIIMSETCWAHKKWNKIASGIKLVFYSSTITMMHGPINTRLTSQYWHYSQTSLCTTFVNNQLDAQYFFLYSFIPVLYMFRATKCSSSAESIVSIWPLVYVTVCRWHTPEVALIQLTLLLMSTCLLETCRELE